MDKYSCFNRAPAARTLLVQDGWDYDATLVRPAERGGVVLSRLPVLKEIPNPFVFDDVCHYRPQKPDSRCEGCVHAVQV